MREVRKPVSRLPNLLIAGVPKAGTTSLYSYLSQHPQVCPSLVKEVNYFTALRYDDASLAPIAEYRKQFSNWSGEAYLMEASPGYAIGGDPVIAGIKRVLGQPRVIIILRDPTQRMWSAYTFQVARGQMKGVSSFEEFVTACEQNRLKGADRVPGNLFAALSMGYYANYMREWLTAFEDDLRVVFAEQLSATPQMVIEDVCRWLEIDVEPVGSFDFRPRNRTLKARSAMLGRTSYIVKRATKPIRRTPVARSVLLKAYEKMNRGEFHEKFRPETRRRLEHMYRQSNVELAEQLSKLGYRQLPAWLDVCDDG